ncbi:MAG: hypothetical protein NTX25_03055 [Proteobacteria bacterium]|nr:hypothetical protein [Pseudomonadota bacterium]
MLIKNPLTYGKRKPVVRPLPVTKKTLAPVELKNRSKIFPSILKSIQKFSKKYPHIIVVGMIFIFLFIWDYLNLITFISLGFFCLILSDHLAEVGKNWHKDSNQRKKSEKESQEKSKQELNNLIKSNYYAGLAKKRASRILN